MKGVHQQDADEGRIAEGHRLDLGKNRFQPFAPRPFQHAKSFLLVSTFVHSRSGNPCLPLARGCHLSRQ